MGLKLVEDTNVATLPVVNMNDVPARLRDIADRIEAQEPDGQDLSALVIVTDRSQQIVTERWGRSSDALWVTCLEMFKIRILENIMRKVL